MLSALKDSSTAQAQRLQRVHEPQSSRLDGYSFAKKPLHISGFSSAMRTFTRPPCNVRRRQSSSAALP